MRDLQLDMVEGLALFETLPDWSDPDLVAKLGEAWALPVTQDEKIAGLLLTSSEGEPSVRRAVADRLDLQMQSWGASLGTGPGVSPLRRLGRALTVHRWLGGPVDEHCAGVLAMLVRAARVSLLDPAPQPTGMILGS